MSAAPSWPLVSSPLEGEASGHDCHRPRVEFRPISPGCERIFRIKVLNLFYRPSKRKMTRGAHSRSRPSKPVLSRTAKARNRLSPNGLRREPRCSPHRPCFRAAIPIWDSNRRDSRDKLPSLHTFLCTTRVRVEPDRVPLAVKGRAEPGLPCLKLVNPRTTCSGISPGEPGLT